MIGRLALCEAEESLLFLHQTGSSPCQTLVKLYKILALWRVEEIGEQSD